MDTESEDSGAEDERAEEEICDGLRYNEFEDVVNHLVKYYRKRVHEKKLGTPERERLDKSYKYFSSLAHRLGLSLSDHIVARREDVPAGIIAQVRKHAAVDFASAARSTIATTSGSPSAAPSTPTPAQTSHVPTARLPLASAASTTRPPPIAPPSSPLTARNLPPLQAVRSSSVSATPSTTISQPRVPSGSNPCEYFHQNAPHNTLTSFQQIGSTATVGCVGKSRQWRLSGDGG